MIPTKAEVEARVQKKIVEMIEFSRTEFGAIIPQFKAKISFRNCRRLGRAGTDKCGNPTMRLNLYNLVTYPVRGYTEYKSLAYRRPIGSFMTNDWTVWLDALVAHEFAHVVQFTLYMGRIKSDPMSQFRPMKFEGIGYFERGHGRFFQTIYRALRAQFVNPRITDYSVPAKDSDTFDTGGEPMFKTKRELKPCKFNGAKLYISGRLYTVIGANARGRVYPYIAENAETKHRYKLSESHIKQYMIKDDAVA